MTPDESHGSVAASRDLGSSAAIDERLRGHDRDALTALYQLTRNLADAASVPELAAACAQRLFVALPRATHVTLFLPDPSGALAPTYMHQRGEDSIGSAAHPLSSTLLARVVAAREALLVTDAPRELDDAASVAAAEIHATLCVPLYTQRALAGVLQIDSRDPLGLFSERDLDLVTVFGEQLATVLEGTALRERLARAEAHLRHENLALRASLEASLIAGSRVMREVHQRIELAAREALPLWVVGETGTGKEVVARTVHAVGERREHPFVAVNCAAIPRELIESELFGHARGAFSGANAPRTGLFREASGGTLFLDEISELPIDLQAKLLRAVEQAMVRPVGADREVPVDVRIIAATHRDPDALVAAGLFRPDLRYRLDVLRIDLPPLRERLEDIPALADHFLAGYCATSRRALRGIDPQALDALLAHAWPGNVRELKNEIERAAAHTATGEPIRAEALSARLAASVRHSAGATVAGTKDGEPNGALRDVVEAVERRFILQALAKHEGNITRAADALGLSRPGLRLKMERYGIARPADSEPHDV